MNSDGGAKLMPLEIMENIFSQIPFQTLMRNCTAVCREWNRIIANPKFLIWKKTYRKLIFGCLTTYQKCQEIIDEEKLMESPETFTPKLCEFIKHFRRKNDALLISLRYHSKYNIILPYVKSACKSIRKSAWGVITLLTIVSTTVQDITDIILAMTSKHSNCLVIETIELLYLLATVFWMLKSQGRINSGLHYRIIYACHLFENGSVINEEPPGTQNQGSSSQVPLTQEQLAIINNDIKPNDIFKIVAFAGTGKTSTLCEYTKRRPGMNFLNVTYNKSIQIHAQTIFPSINVESRTMHSLAYRAVGVKFRNKLGSGLRSTDVQRVLSKETTFIHAERVVQTMEHFVASSRRVITKEDVTRSKFSTDDKEKEYFDSNEYKYIVVNDAKRIWNKMINVNDKEIYMTHDGYLKLYQLSQPCLDCYDCILVDEAQDLTPAVAAILLSQRCSKILVGDPHQQIYSFRGAENAMESVDSTHTFYLTQSFRFGPEIAYVANSLLEVQKDFQGKTLVGGRKEGGIMGDTVGQLAIICRSNFGVFSEASKLCCSGNNIKVAFAGGIKGYSLDRVLDIYHLYVGYGHQHIRDPFIKRFRTYTDLKRFVNDANDKELGAKMKIVESFTSNVPTYIEAIMRNVVDDTSQADVVVSTAHKAKGLEFDTVRINDDFTLVNQQEVNQVAEEDIRDEQNLLYVAVTRAKIRLILNKTIISALHMNKEYLLRPVATDAYDGNGSISCTFCRNPVICDPMPSIFVEHPRRTIYNKSLKEEKGQGFLCSECVLSKVPYLHCLLYPRHKEKTKKENNGRRSSI